MPRGLGGALQLRDKGQALRVLVLRGWEYWLGTALGHATPFQARVSPVKAPACSLPGEAGLGTQAP